MTAIVLKPFLFASPQFFHPHQNIRSGVWIQSPLFIEGQYVMGERNMLVPNRIQKRSSRAFAGKLERPIGTKQQAHCHKAQIKNMQIERLLNRLFEGRPTLKSLQKAKTLGDYLAPVLAWQFHPSLFPNASLLLGLIIEEIRICYGKEIAERAAQQLQQNFAVETGAHVSLPRLYDRATIQSIPLSNVNTLVFQSTLYSAAARLAAGQTLNISCSTGRIFLSNLNGGSYFQPDREQIVRLQPNKWDKTPQCYLPSLTPDAFEKALGKTQLTEAGQKRAHIFEQSIKRHPESFSRQLVTTHSALYNEALPKGIKQVSIDYELIIPEFLIALLKDSNSVTHQLFTTERGLDFLLNEFADVNTAWKRGEAPFDELETTRGVLRVSHTPYSGSLTPSALCEALAARTIMPKTALIFLVFLLEAGVAPTGGMMQTLYSTQIRDRLVAWLRVNRPKDPRIEALASIPTDRAVLTPLWGVLAETPEHPISYREALNGWHMDEKTAQSLLQVSGDTALKGGAILMNNFIFGDKKITDEEKQDMLHELAKQSDILKLT